MKTIEEKNRIIAEFMGYVNTTPTDPDFNIMENADGKMIEPMSTKYHTSWDWLMPVIDKIEELPYIVEVGRFTTIRKSHLANLHIPEYAETTSYTNGGTRLDSAYKAVVKFIEWYNEKW